MTKVREICNYLESIAPLSYQESYDNCGLLTGHHEMDVKGILITLDVTEEVVLEAIKGNQNLIIAHHPIIFKGLKKLNGSNYVERTIILAIKHDIAIYAIHTNLDNVSNGVNKKIADKLNLLQTEILSPKKQLLKKLVTFIPVKDTDSVLAEIHKAGAGEIGNYSECSFQVTGRGAFKPNTEANPTIGSAEVREVVEENRVEVIFPSYIENKIVKALLKSHPYEEPAFDLFLLENANSEIGSGMIGNLPQPMKEEDFFHYLKERMNLSVIKATQFTGTLITRVAVCGGAGSFLLKNAIQGGAQVYVSSDFKYHEYFDAENKIIIADIGHYESEVFTKDLIFAFLNKKFTNIALVLSKTVTNPIQYI